MLSRKEFLRELLFQNFRTVSDLSAEAENASAEPVADGPGFNLPATELSPSLLVIEAELRRIRLETGKAEELQQEIYQKMVQNLQNQKDLAMKGG